MLVSPRALDMNANAEFSPLHQRRLKQQMNNTRLHDNHRHHLLAHLGQNQNTTAFMQQQQQQQQQQQDLSRRAFQNNSTATKSSFSPRLGHRVKFPPHITICAPDSGDVTALKYEELDNEVFHSPPSPTTSSPTRTRAVPSDEKHEVHAGRLYLIRHSGSGSSGGGGSPVPPSSPSKSPSRSPVTSFPFRSSPPFMTSSQSSSPSSSTSSPPPFSPSPLSCSPPTTGQGNSPLGPRKTSVYVRVYRCNLDHFAVISRDAVYTAKPVYVNIRRCRLIPGDTLGRFVLAGKLDSGELIEFETPELSSLEQWLDVFQTCTPPGSPSRMAGGAGSGANAASGGGAGGGANVNTPPIPRSPALPTLTETDEEN
ncbi:AT-rich interactive domain-containing protein 1B [Aplysia californica]|uniref:AT-rich interactive domain-containing protein 1B n=1 Tax=Aplysia californica TaxID=6500 RepID=A0ABM0JWZ9_APLCA|nr:AT-rich interactive domain-containing protein 1B [Aplysia californica]